MWNHFLQHSLLQPIHALSTFHSLLPRQDSQAAQQLSSWISTSSSLSSKTTLSSLSEEDAARRVLLPTVLLPFSCASSCLWILFCFISSCCLNFSRFSSCFCVSIWKYALPVIASGRSFFLNLLVLIKESESLKYFWNEGKELELAV